jgi:hypothetical protein
MGLRCRLTVVSAGILLQASAWERTAQLDDQQLRVIDALAAVVGHRPFPAHVSKHMQRSALSSSNCCPEGSLCDSSRLWRQLQNDVADVLVTSSALTSQSAAMDGASADIKPMSLYVPLYKGS